jgi:hypothetical protein
MTQTTRTPKVIHFRFKREFTEGGLKGVQGIDTITHTNLQAASDWMQAINRKSAAGKVKYKVLWIESIDYPGHQYTFRAN